MWGDRVIPLLVVTAVFLLAAAWRFWRVLKPVFAAPAVDRFDHPWQRLKGVFGDVGLHWRLLRMRYSGILHAFMFSGFLVLLTVTLQSFGEGLFKGFSLAAIGGDTWIALLQNIFAVLVVVALLMAAYQRGVLKPKRFATSRKSDAWLIYGLVGAVVFTLVIEAALRQVATNNLTAWRPISSLIAGFFMQVGMGQQIALSGEKIFYWGHIVTILAFLAYIPGSKHRHIFTAIPNIYFRALDRASELPPVNLEKSPIGVSEISQFNWKHKLDLISCTECGRCEAACPANAAGLPLSPKLVVMDLRDHMFDWSAGLETKGPMVGGVISEETLFSCTTCRACMDVCPVRIEPMTKIIELRRTAIENGSVEPMLQEALSNLQRTGNSQGKPPRHRARWTQDLPFKIKDAREEQVDVLWFVGDHASFDPRVQTITRKVATLLHAAGVDFGILYDAEQNSGNDVRRVGDEGAFEVLAKANIEALSQCAFKRIVTTDPHTLNALRNDYAQFGVEYDVVHYTQLLLELVDSKHLVLQSGGGETVTYHDPCYLGRYSSEFDAPRELIARAGYRLQDMPRSREGSFCCGAGGGRIWMNDSAMTERPSENRIKEALELGDVTSFIVTCPKDTIMYGAAIQALGVAHRIKVQDLADLLTAVSTENPDQDKQEIIQ
jgi:Fe-S oxidoreductase